MTKTKAQVLKEFGAMRYELRRTKVALGKVQAQAAHLATQNTDLIKALRESQAKVDKWLFERIKDHPL